MTEAARAGLKGGCLKSSCERHLRGILEKEDFTACEAFYSIAILINNIKSHET